MAFKFIEALIEFTTGGSDATVIESIDKIAQKMRAAGLSGDAATTSSPLGDNLNGLKATLGGLDETVRKLDAAIGRLFEGRGAGLARRVSDDVRAASRVAKEASDIEKAFVKQQQSSNKSLTKEYTLRGGSESDVIKRQMKEKEYLDSLRRDQAAKDNASLTKEYTLRGRKQSDLIKARMKEEEKASRNTEPKGFFELFGRGTTPRRAIATGTHQVFAKMFGDAFASSQVSQALTGVFGLIGGGMALQIGFAITNALMSLPGMIAGNAEKRGQLSAGLPQKGTLSGDYEEIFARNRILYGSLPGGQETLDMYQRTLQFAQNRRVIKSNDPESKKAIEEGINRVLTLSIGSGEMNPEEAAIAYIEMKAGNAKQAIPKLGKMAPIREALRELLAGGDPNSQYAGPKGAGLVENLLDRGMVSRENMEKAIEQAVNPNKGGTGKVDVVGRVTGMSAGGSAMGEWRQIQDQFWNMFVHPIDQTKELVYGAFDSLNRPLGYDQGIARDLPGLDPSGRGGKKRGFTASPFVSSRNDEIDAIRQRVSDERDKLLPDPTRSITGRRFENTNDFKLGVNPSVLQQFQFSSLSGLAEKMQTQAVPGGGGPDEKTATNTKETADATKALRDHFVGKPQVPAPAPAFGKK